MPIKGVFLKKPYFAIHLFLHVDFLPQHKDKRTLEFSPRSANLHINQNVGLHVQPWTLPVMALSTPGSVLSSVRIPFLAGISGLALLGTAQVWNPAEPEQPRSARGGQCGPWNASGRAAGWHSWNCHLWASVLGLLNQSCACAKPSPWAEPLQVRVGSAPPTAATTRSQWLLTFQNPCPFMHS